MQIYKFKVRFTRRASPVYVEYEDTVTTTGSATADYAARRQIGRILQPIVIFTHVRQTAPPTHGHCCYVQCFCPSWRTKDF